MSSAALAAEFTREDANKIGAAYVDGFNKKDSGAIMALYTKDGVLYSLAGVRNPAEYYNETFKAGFDKLDVAIEQVAEMSPQPTALLGVSSPYGK